jgi:hypothetical protein
LVANEVERVQMQPDNLAVIWPREKGEKSTGVAFFASIAGKPIRQIAKTPLSAQFKTHFGAKT